jgi:hypothetical protein
MRHRLSRSITASFALKLANPPRQSCVLRPGRQITRKTEQEHRQKT